MTASQAAAALVNPAVLEYRVKQAEKAIEVKADKDYVDQIANEVRGLRKAVYTLLASIVGSSVLVSLTLFATLGSHIGG